MTLAPPRGTIHQPSPRTETSSPSDQGVARHAARPVIVTGLMVVHDGAAWLDECLDALGLQTRPLDRLVIVDTGSIDESREIAASHDRIRQVIGDVTTITAPRGSTFGDAVGRAVDQLLARSVWSVGAIAGEPRSGDPSQVEWLWLL